MRRNLPYLPFLKRTNPSCKLFLFILLLCLSVISSAETLPQSYASDPHIQIVTYDPNQVYRVTGYQGFTTAIQFSDDEQILSVNIGDSSAWLVNVQANVINLKPTTDNPDTNMNVVTSRGSYQFFLTAPAPRRDASGHVTRRINSRAIFLLRFRYPNAQQELTYSRRTCAKGFNTCYSARGDRSIAPIYVYDDGRFTYFNFASCHHIPAIFTVDCDRHEAIVNYHLQGNLVVVETVAKQFTLRDGCHVASIFNEAPCL